MKKYTCKMIPKNEELKVEEYEIEVEDTCKDTKIYAYILIGAFAAFCMGMAIAVFAWTAYVNLYGPAIEYFYSMVSAFVILTVSPTVCGTVIICKCISARNRAKCQLESKIIEGAAKKCASQTTDAKNEKGINLKFTKF